MPQIQPGITVLMPCLNEAETLVFCIKEAQESLNKIAMSSEILIADNGSNDNSRDLARTAGARVIEVSLKGYGSALKAGISSAKFEYIIMGDADGSYDFSNIPSFIEKLDEGYDLVMGNRFQGKIHKGAMPWLHRYIGNPVLSTLSQIVFTNKVGDFHSGLRSFSKSEILTLTLRSSGMEFATELIALASKGKLRITEIPTSLRPDGRSRPPHLRTWRDGWRHLKFIILYSPSWTFLVPGFLLSSLGTIGFILTSKKDFHFGSVGLSIGSEIVSMLFLSTGYQILLMGVLAKVFIDKVGIFSLNKKTRKFLQIFTPDRALLVGGILFAVGIYPIFSEFIIWKSQNFAKLQTISEIRTLTKAILLSMIGLQSILYGVFLGLLGLIDEKEVN